MAGLDWVQWHQGYDDPDSSLSARLRVVRQRIGEALDVVGTPAPRILSLCAGDIRATLVAASTMVAPGGHVIWTRGRFEHADLRDDVRRWTVEAGFTEVAYDGAPASYGVGLYRWDRPQSTTSLPPRLFTFTR